MAPFSSPTIADQLAVWAHELQEQLLALISDHGAPYDWARDGAFVIITGTPYAWPQLSREGERLQSWLIQEYRAYIGLLRVVLAGQSEAAVRAFEDAEGRLVRLIERAHHPHRTTEEATEQVNAAFAQHLDVLRGIFSGADDLTLILPDTNALYWNPALEHWRVPSGTPFTLVLTPTVIAELDRHKVDERASGRRAKAERLVNQIREYRRRGRLMDGVPLVAGISTITAIASEPRMADSLAWLDATHADDRFLATTLEVIRAHTRCRVLVATRDTNLQNKLELARLPFCDPAELVASA